MLALVLFACFQSSGEVVGLRAGESVVVLDALERVTSSIPRDQVRPRVVHATTSVPLEGVRIEAWTEGGESKQVGLEICIDRALTQHDGTARLAAKMGAVEAEKFRFSKPGFASRTMTRSDFAENVGLHPVLPLEGRVLDLDGIPVANAVVRTRETCSHAIPAAATRTDAFGRFRLEDCPAEEGGPDLEVISNAHEPLFQLDTGWLRSLAARYGTLELRVARRSPLEYRIVGRDGVPLAHRHILRAFVPAAETWTDEEGRCTLSPPDEGRAIALSISDIGPPQVLQPVYAPVGLITTLSPAFADDDEGSAIGRVNVEFRGPAAESSTPPSVEIIDARGHAAWSKGGEVAVAPGPCRVQLGGGFTGWKPIVREITVAGTPVQVVLEPQREPVLSVKVPFEQVLRFVVQAGRESATRPMEWCKEGVLERSVPAGEPLTIFVESLEGEQRMLRHAPIADDTEIDLRPDATIVRPSTSSLEQRTGTLRFVVTERGGGKIEGLEGGVTAFSKSIESEPANSGRFEWVLPAREGFRASFSAAGCSTARIEGLVPEHGAVQTMSIELVRLSRVELRGNVTALDVGGPDPEPVEGGFDVEAVPGPLMMRIAREGKAPLALDLVLAPGETRRIDVR